MAKPSIKKVYPFDANADKTIEFSYAGNQAYSNRLIVKNATTFNVVYDSGYVSTRKYQNTIPANTLTNGVKYAATITCRDGEEIESPTSNTIYFYALSTPTFKFCELTDGETLITESPYLSIEYYQEEVDELSQAQFFLYDSNKNLITKSKIYYGTSEPEHIFRGLDNDTSYYVRCTGKTESEISCDTGYVLINIKYENPTLYNFIQLDADDCGIVNGSTHFTIISPDRLEYSFDGEYVDLTNDFINYSNGFEINGDFKFGIQFKSASDGLIFTMSNSNDETIKIYQVIDDPDQKRYKLTVNNIYDKLVIYSDANTVTSSDTMTVWVERINNVYSLTAIKGGV